VQQRGARWNPGGVCSTMGITISCGVAMLGPTLETDRLVLRPPGAEDFDAWATMMADPEAMRFLGGPQPPAGAWRNLALMTGAWVIQGFGNFSVIEKASRRWIGRAGPWQPRGWPGPEIGWAFDRTAWGNGYATEAALCCLTFAFETLGWNHVVHPIDPPNVASIAVARKIGSVRLGPARLPWPYETIVTDLYGQSRADWESRRAMSMRISD
jgi:RimJ/RimL family protein N-acetyltransferase